MEQDSRRNEFGVLVNLELTLIEIRLKEIKHQTFMFSDTSLSAVTVELPSVVMKAAGTSGLFHPNHSLLLLGTAAAVDQYNALNARLGLFGHDEIASPYIEKNAKTVITRMERHRKEILFGCRMLRRQLDLESPGELSKTDSATYLILEYAE